MPASLKPLIWTTAGTQGNSLSQLPIPPSGGPVSPESASATIWGRTPAALAATLRQSLAQGRQRSRHGERCDDCPRGPSGGT